MPLRRALPVVLTLLAAAADAGDWHADRSLACSDCHTMHNSRNGQPMRYDASATPAANLLRAETVTALCLACHRGDAATHAPSVMSPSSWDPPGGGFPSDLSDPGHTAHALGTAPVVPPDGDTAVVMTCVTCHATHGSAGYRNLRASPSGSGRSAAAPVVEQAVKANGTNPELVYLRSNVRYVSGLSAWCMDCHDTLPTIHASIGHPWDVPIFGAARADWAQWAAPITNRVPVENPLGLAAPSPSEGDRVFCLSCHKAHGSRSPSALIYADGLTQSSTCQQCHNM